MTEGALAITVGLPATQVRRAARAMADCLDEAIASRGRATLALSGGSTVAPLFQALADLPVMWSRVDLLQVDERVVPDGHPDRNMGLVQTHLLERLPDARPRVHALPVTATDLSAAAADHARTLAELAGTPPVLDVIQLGLGPDGHTASLLPDELTGRDPLSPPIVLTGPYQGHRRMTLSLPVLSAARRIVWLVLGAERAGAVRRLVQGDDTIPAAAVARSRAALYADRAAAAML